ncbi:hypothetical protein CEE37_00850 [candidate division LCP-89 bacterium B3_LCP]|uniref:YbbR domain pair protein n=1 Tax=candidate division LCP-89 bacterium B3_LCP TaxID=2012998 RepID=A0A532V506_UNCL8|nr:MAG: hypothetical protein CEE37_00850 [candidate division LCP-89 bacterium B3_LCP]
MNWRKFFFKNYPAKIALLLMAVFLWFFVITGRNYDQVLNIPISITNLQENRVFLQTPESEAVIRFRGKGTSLLLLSLFGDAHINLDIASIKQFYNYPIRLEHVKWAPGINVQVDEVLSPDTVHIRLDDKVQCKKKIQPMLNVIPAEGYGIISPVKCKPDSAELIGPKTILDGLSFISTQVKEIDGATTPINMKLGLIPPEGGTVDVSPVDVRVIVQIDKIVEKQLTDVPVSVINCPPDQPGTCEPPTVDVKLIGARSVLDDIQRDNLMVSVSAGGHQTSTETLTPLVHLPDHVELLEVIPDTVKIIY